MKLRRAIALAACAALVIGAAGCGGDDDGGDTTAVETQTKDEWVKQADQICAAADTEIQQAAEDAGLSSDSSPEELESFYTETVLPSIEEQRDQIEALPAPEGEEDAAAEMIDALDQAIEDAKADPGALVQGDGSAFDDVNQKASDLGLTDCGDGSG